MSIIIASRRLSRELAQENPGRYNIISILEPDVPEAPEEIRNYSNNFLPLVFHDIEYVRDGYSEPKIEHVQEALSWAEGKDELVVACLAGISRSSAIAYLVQCTREYHPRLALKILTPLRHHPNSLIVKLGAEILKNSDIVDEYYRWLGEQAF